jgi:glycosyltransferase involved in cell wall biosynthesis
VSSSIHIWVPGLRDGTGGIQAFSRFFVQAVHQAFPDATIRVFIKNDTLSANDPLRSLPVKFYSVGWVPGPVRTLAMVSLGLGLGVLDKPLFTLATHVHFLPALRVLRGLTGVRCGTVLHGIEAWQLSGWPRLSALRQADEIMAVSEFTRQYVIHHFGVDAGHVRVLPNTFDENRFTPGPKPVHLLARHGIMRQQPVLLTVSRLLLSERYKGHSQVLAALPHLLTQFPGLRYVIVGVGDGLPPLAEMVRALGLDDVVIFAGHVPGSELADYYRLCDVFVMPSAKEGFGIVFLEAMGCGKPVVAGNLDGSVDALDHGRLGSLVDPSDPGAIGNAISALLSRRSDHPLWLDPAALSRETVRTFGAERVQKLLASLLKRISDPKAGAEMSTIHAPKSSFGPDQTPHDPTLARSKYRRVVVVTQFTSPYHIELFNEVAKQWSCQLEVIYLTDRDPDRHWTRPLMAHNFIILDGTGNSANQVRNAVAGADLCIFNFYTRPIALSLIHQRAALGLPWCFWGERPGVFRLGPLGKWFRKLALGPLHRSKAPIWGVGEFGVDGYRREFGSNHVFWNMPYYSNLSRFGREPRMVRQGNVKTFLYSGAFILRKGLNILARAFAKIATERQDVRLIIMGEGRLEASVRAELASVADKVTWTGFQDWKHLPKFYQQADFLCAPSRYDGWGLAVVEALASGLPVLGTNRSGASIQFVKTGHNGWLIPAGDEAALASALRAAADLTAEQYAEMSRAAATSVKDHSLAKGAEAFARASLDAIASWPNKS